MPTSRAGSASQNERWELGRMQLARRYVPALVSRVTRSRDRRIAHADAVLDHLLPPLSVLAIAQAASVLSAAALYARPGHSRRRGADRLRLVLGACSAATLAVHVLVGLRSVDAPPAVYRSLLGAPRAIAWKAALWVRVMIVPERVAWIRTERNSDTRAEASG
jgi:hypothetical protein